MPERSASLKQLGLIYRLHRQLGRRPPVEALKALTMDEASDLIERLMRDLERPDALREASGVWSRELWRARGEEW